MSKPLKRLMCATRANKERLLEITDGLVEILVAMQIQNKRMNVSFGGDKLIKLLVDPVVPVIDDTAVEIDMLNTAVNLIKDICDGQYRKVSFVKSEKLLKQLTTVKLLTRLETGDEEDKKELIVVQYPKREEDDKTVIDFEDIQNAVILDAEQTAKLIEAFKASGVEESEGVVRPDAVFEDFLNTYQGIEVRTRRKHQRLLIDHTCKSRIDKLNKEYTTTLDVFKGFLADANSDGFVSIGHKRKNRFYEDGGRKIESKYWIRDVQNAAAEKFEAYREYLALYDKIVERNNKDWASFNNA